MQSYTAHFTRPDGQRATMVVRATSHEQAARVSESILDASYRGKVPLGRVQLVNDHQARATTRSDTYGPRVPYLPCDTDVDGTCKQHGGTMLGSGGCRTIEVLADVRAERSRQFARYGTNANLEDGTGPEVQWLYGTRWTDDARTAESAIRDDYEAYEEQHGAPTWRHLVLEEVAEVFMESDPARLREELVQVAALAVSWIEKLDARADGEEG